MNINDKLLYFCAVPMAVAVLGVVLIGQAGPIEALAMVAIAIILALAGEKPSSTIEGGLER